MSVYFIHAEAVLSSGGVAERIGKVVEASDAFVAENKFLYDEDVMRLTRQGISVVIDKFERVE